MFVWSNAVFSTILDLFSFFKDKIYFHHLTKNKSSEPPKLTVSSPTSFVALFPPQETEHSFSSNSLLGWHPSHHRSFPQTIVYHPIFPTSCHHCSHCPNPLFPISLVTLISLNAPFAQPILVRVRPLSKWYPLSAPTSSLSSLSFVVITAGLSYHVPITVWNVFQVPSPIFIPFPFVVRR